MQLSTIILENVGVSQCCQSCRHLQTILHLLEHLFRGAYSAQLKALAVAK